MDHCDSPVAAAPDRAGVWRSLTPAVALLVVSLAGTVIAGVWPRADAVEVAVLAADFPAAAGVVAAAGGALVAGTALPGLVIARSPDPADPSFHDRLHAAGALLLLDPQGLAGCGVTARPLADSTSRPHGDRSP